jgi:hypothetical protein
MLGLDWQLDILNFLELITTKNYNSFTDLYTLKITTALTKSSQSGVPGNKLQQRPLLLISLLAGNGLTPNPLLQMYLHILDWLKVGQSVKLLLAFASTVVPGFSLLEIHDQDFCSLLDMQVVRNGASLSTKEGSVFLCRRYVYCTTECSKWFSLYSLSTDPRESTISSRSSTVQSHVYWAIA